MANVNPYSSIWYNIPNKELYYEGWLYEITGHVRVNLLKIIKENRDFGSTITSFICRNSIRFHHDTGLRRNNVAPPIRRLGQSIVKREYFVRVITYVVY
jgi:hypothetical protein